MTLSTLMEQTQPEILQGLRVMLQICSIE